MFAWTTSRLRISEFISVNGKPTVRNPFSTYKDSDGTLKFRETISLPPNVKGEIDALIITEFFRRLKENQNANANR